MGRGQALKSALCAPCTQRLPTYLIKLGTKLIWSGCIVFARHTGGGGGGVRPRFVTIWMETVSGPEPHTAPNSESLMTPHALAMALTPKSNSWALVGICTRIATWAQAAVSGDKRVYCNPHSNPLCLGSTHPHVSLSNPTLGYRANQLPSAYLLPAHFCQYQQGSGLLSQTWESSEHPPSKPCRHENINKGKINAHHCSHVEGCGFICSLVWWERGTEDDLLMSRSSTAAAPPLGTPILVVRSK